MAETISGIVQSGGLVLATPLDLPDGTAVLVSVAFDTPKADRLSPDEFKALPFFGMHREMADARDAVEIVNEARAKWVRRPLRRD